MQILTVDGNPKMVGEENESISLGEESYNFAQAKGIRVFQITNPGISPTLTRPGVRPSAPRKRQKEMVIIALITLSDGIGLYTCNGIKRTLVEDSGDIWATWEVAYSKACDV